MLQGKKILFSALQKPNKEAIPLYSKSKIQDPVSFFTYTWKLTDMKFNSLKHKASFFLKAKNITLSN